MGNLAKKEGNLHGKITLYPNELDFLFTKFNSFSAFKLYLFILKTSNYTRNPENLNNFSHTRLAEKLSSYRQNISRDLKTLENMGLIERTKSSITRIYRVMELIGNDVDNHSQNVGKENQNDYRCNQIDDKKASIRLQECINLMTEKHQIDYAKCPNELLALLSGPSLQLFNSFSTTSLGGEFDILNSFLSEVRKGDFRKKYKFQILVLMAFYGIDEVSDEIQNLRISGQHILSIPEKLIEKFVLKISEKKKVNVPVLMQILKSGPERWSDIPNELNLTLTNTDKNFIEQYGLKSLSYTTEFEIKRLAKDFEPLI